MSVLPQVGVSRGKRVRISPSPSQLIVQSERLSISSTPTAALLGLAACALELRQSDDFWVATLANQLRCQSAAAKMLDKATYDFLVACQRASSDAQQHDIESRSHFCLGSNSNRERRHQYLPENVTRRQPVGVTGLTGFPTRMERRAPVANFGWRLRRFGLWFGFALGFRASAVWVA